MRLTVLDQVIKNEQTVAMSTSQPLRKPRNAGATTRIQAERRGLILDGALQVFAQQGFRGGTVDEIAARCGLSKPNVLYYFPSKERIYRAVLERTLDSWLAPLRDLDATGDPITELTRYIERKIDLSFAMPEASRLFANEVLHGAPHIKDFMAGPLRELVTDKARILRGWMEEGRLLRLDPYHLIFSIWATTQHYADFASQIEAVTARPASADDAKSTILGIILHGIAPNRQI